MQNKHKNHPNLFSAFLPTAWTDAFDVTDIEERSTEWRIVLTEKETCIPSALTGKRAVLDGYRDTLELVDFPLRGKLLYVRFIRRRWKEAGQTTGYHNTYNFHPKGARVTNDFGAFLKELTREEFDQLCSAWPGLRDCR